MKLKGVNPIVQHIEKLVLGLTALALLAVISMQFVSQSNQIDTGTRKVNPDQIYNELESKANALQSQLSDQSPSLPDIQPVNLVESYNRAFESSGDSIMQLASSLGTGTDIASLLGTEIDVVKTDFGPIESMRVPQTSTPIAASSWATLDPYAVLEVPQYADFVPSAQPFDFSSVSIEADFSGTALRDVLEGKGDHPGIPRNFWISTGMAVMGLDVERQELQADGSWSASQPITTPPSTPLPTNAVSKDDALVRLNQIIASAQDVAGEVMRPAFPPTISGPDWQPPSDSIDSADLGLSETQLLQRKLTRYTAEVDRLKNPTRTAPTRTTSTGGRGGRGGKTSNQDPGPSNTSTSSSNDRNKLKIERLEKQIEDIKSDLDRLGVDAADADTSSASLNILDQEFIQLWAHDLGAQPGKTYRYRTRAVLNNPYFRKGPYLDESDDTQQALTIEPFARGDWSNWSNPVDVGAKEFFFVTEASSPIAGATPPQARVELYSMYYGYYRRSSLNINPGESLLADLRISGDLFMFDTETIKPDAVNTYIADVNQNTADPTLPDGVTEAPSRLSINLGAFLLGVTPDPIVPANAQEGDAPATTLLFRLPDGSISHRSPANDRNSQIYSQAQSSATKASRATLRPAGQPASSEAADLFQKTEP